MVDRPIGHLPRNHGLGVDRKLMAEADQEGIDRRCGPLAGRILDLGDLVHAPVATGDEKRSIGGIVFGINPPDDQAACGDILPTPIAHYRRAEPLGSPPHHQSHDIDSFP